MNKILRILGKKGRITIPYEYRLRLGIRTGDVISFATDGKNEVILKKEKICDNCASKDTKKPTDETTLLEFLDDLTPEEQHAAFIHLAVIRAQKEAKKNG